VPLRNFAGWMLTAFVVFLIYRLLERKLPLRPLQGYRSRMMAFLPVAAYGMMALIDAWLGYPEIEDIHLISPFVMGIPFLFASFKLFAQRTDIPLWPWQHKVEDDA
jgi:putative membrane protein